MSVLLSGLEGVRGNLAGPKEHFEDPRLSRSLMAGLLILTILPADGSYIKNAHIADGLGMNPSTVHRYLSTLLVVGLAERDPATRRYRLAHISTPDEPLQGARSTQAVVEESL